VPLLAKIRSPTTAAYFAALRLIPEVGEFAHAQSRFSGKGINLHPFKTLFAFAGL
jgi:hypothetical protein